MERSGSSSSLQSTPSPRGVSRYGRTIKSKLSPNFCHIDEALLSEELSTISNGFVNPNKKIKSGSANGLISDYKCVPKREFKCESEVRRELDLNEDIKRESLRVLNDVLESAPIDDVLKIFNKPKIEDCSQKLTKKSPVRTYVNKKKVVTPQSRVLESFGLPDDPIVPFYGEKLVFKPFKGLDIEKGAPESVTLVDTFIGNILKEDLGWINDKEEEVNCFSQDSKFVSLKNDEMSKAFEKNGENGEINSFAVVIKENYKKMKSKLVNVGKNDKMDEVKQECDLNLSKNRVSEDKIKSEIPNKEKIKANKSKVNGTIIDFNEDLIKTFQVKTKEPDKDDTENIVELTKEERCDENLDKSQPIDVKTKREADIPNNIDAEIFVGQLMWARFGKFPYWPCMVAEDPNSKDVTRNNGYLQKFKVHVRFFGDRGRSSWIPRTHLLVYTTLEELQQRSDPWKKQCRRALKSAYFYRSWRQAITEADSLKDKSLEEKLTFFETVLKERNEDKQRKRLERKSRRLEKIKRGEEIRNDEEIVSEPIIEKQVVPNPSPSPSFKRKSRKSEEVVESSESELSINPFPESLEEQLAIYKRNNLFKKVTREKVCQICFKSENVLRCKGHCQGFYHLECVQRELEEITKVKNEQNDSIWNGKQVEIISIKDRRGLTPTNLTLTNDNEKFNGLSLNEKIDCKMSEIMKDFEGGKAIYLESTDSSENSMIENFSDNKTNEEVLCKKCWLNSNPVCFICEKTISSLHSKDEDKNLRLCLENNGTNLKNEEISLKNYKNHLQNKEVNIQTDKKEFDNEVKVLKFEESHPERCSVLKCNKFFHPECLKTWPQTQWSITSKKYLKHSQNSNEFICPMHVCHICVSDNPRSSYSRCYGEKFVKCIYCPSTYHMTTYCVPAGTQILSSTQIICPKHSSEVTQSNNSAKTKRNSSVQQPINTTWCFICSKGGALVCCETCPTSVHSECVNIKYTEDDKFICEDCETGRFPLYDEVVWVKLGHYRWWPALVLFPNEIPERINGLKHNVGDFVVKFFGTYDHYWTNKGRVFLFEEGDAAGAGDGGRYRRKMDKIFKRSIEEGTRVFLLKKAFRESLLRNDKNNSKNRPPPYVKIKVNRPVGSVRQFDANVSNTTPCECDPKQENPCGPDSDCLNRLLLTECDPTVCPAGTKCQNQNFEQRNYPNLVPYKTEARGWGLKSLEPLRKGQFIIEYVGEMIDEEEYQRRVKHMHQLKEENYYFLTIDKDRMIDAGPKGNLARFMNHSCRPNCETQKWTVNGDTRVGLFALDDIEENVELTFNYNLECIGKGKKICLCGAENCSGFIGVKVNKTQQVGIRKRKYRKHKKRQSVGVKTENEVMDRSCFACGEKGSDLKLCDSKICSNYYHLNCVGLETWPEGKWTCPRHNCSICSKRTIRSCVKCINSYCPMHSEGNIRHDKRLGFICCKHDVNLNSPKLTSNQQTGLEVSNIDEVVPNMNVRLNNLDKVISEVIERYSKRNEDGLKLNKRINGIVTSTPYKDEVFKDNLQSDGSNNNNSKRKRNESFAENEFQGKRKKVSKNGLINKLM